MDTITNTKEAAKLAFELDQLGMSKPKIAKELARRRWISRRSGKRLTASGVWLLIGRWKKGDKFENMRGIIKHAGSAGRFAPRPKGPVYTLAEKPEIKQTLAAVQITHQGAYQELVSMAQRFRSMAQAVETLLAAVK